MSASPTPTKKSLARVPSMSSSFASCFGASTPISPRRAGGHGLLGGHAIVSYKKLGFDEDEEEEEEEEKDACIAADQYTRERKLGTQLTVRENARVEVYCASEVRKEEAYASEQEGDECGRERKGILKLGKIWSMREKDSNSSASETLKKQEHEHVYLKKLGRLWTMREKGRMGVCNASETPKEEELGVSEEEGDECGRERKEGGKQSRMREKEGICGGSPRPRKESVCRRVREACVQVFESARRSSPHLSELFVGNQLLMQVTSSSFSARRARNVAPSTGFLVAGEPLSSTVSPPSSSAL